MSWLRLDDNFLDHPKFEPLDDHAVRVWLRALCHCNQHGTEGFVSDRILVRLKCSAKVRKALTTPPEGYSSGLWEEVQGGVQYHDYQDYQRSPATTALSDRGRLGGLASGVSRRAKVAQPLESHEAAASTAGLNEPEAQLEPRTRIPSRPVPSRPDLPPTPEAGASGNGQAEPQTETAEPSETKRDPRLGDAGLLGGEGAAWAEGVRQATGTPQVAPHWRDHARIAEVLRLHAPGLRGQAAADWITACAAAYARDTRARRAMAVISVQDWVRWQGTNGWRLPAIALAPPLAPLAPPPTAEEARENAEAARVAIEAIQAALIGQGPALARAKSSAGSSVVYASAPGIAGTLGTLGTGSASRT